MMRTIGRFLAGASVLALCAGCTDANTAKHNALARGDRAFAAARFGEAAVEYQNALRRDARFGDARWKLAETYERLGNVQAAFGEYVRAADLLPGRVDVQVKAAKYLLVAGRFEDARSRADVALRRDPRNVDALIVRADAAAGLKDLPTAISEIENALKTQPADARMYSSLGALRVMQGENGEAESAFKKAVEVNPASMDARLSLANYYWITGQTAAVERTLVNAKTIDATHLILNRMLAAFYISTNRLPEAEAPLKLVAERGGDPMSRLALADYYVRAQRRADATPLLTALAKQKQTFAPATLRLAQLERDAGHGDAAARLIAQVIKADPRNAEALTLKASWQLTDDDRAGALTSARAAVQADASAPAAQFVLGQALAANKDVDGSIKALNEALRLNPRMAVAQILLSRLQLASGNKEAAVQLALEAQKSAPTSADARITLARSLIATGKPDLAEPLVKALLASFPGQANVHTLDGHLKVVRHDEPGARAAYGRALAIDPDAAEALEALLRLDIAAHALPAAVGRIEARTAKNPNSPALLMVAADTYFATGQHDQAEATLRRLIQLDPDNMTAYQMLGRTYVLEHRLDDALAQFDAAVKRRPGDIGMATMAAMILQLQNKPAEAQKRYEAIVAASPLAAVASNNLAWIYAEQGEHLDTALQLAQSAKLHMPNSPEINDTLGWIYYKKKLPQLAIPPLEQSFAANKSNALFRLHLGLAYAQAGNVTKAREALEPVLRANPSGEGAVLARQALASLKG